MIKHRGAELLESLRMYLVARHRAERSMRERGVSDLQLQTVLHLSDAMQADKIRQLQARRHEARGVGNE